MGDIPAKTNMVSSIITSPQAGGSVDANTSFNITVQMSNLVAGSFTNAQTTYYAAPQTLQNGVVVGHTHVTVQDLGKSLNPTVALDATQFAFFKGINDAGNGKGLLSAAVVGGLPAGNYRVCTMASASNHQPVLMPVAQRGTPVDCTKFTVGGGGKVAGGAKAAAASGAAASSDAAAASGTAVAKGGKGNGGAKAALASSTDAAAAAATTSPAAKGGKGGKKGNQGASVAATTTADTASVASASVAASSSPAATGKGGRNGKGKFAM